MIANHLRNQFSFTVLKTKLPAFTHKNHNFFTFIFDFFKKHFIDFRSILTDVIEEFLLFNIVYHDLQRVSYSTANQIICMST